MTRIGGGGGADGVDAKLLAELPQLLGGGGAFGGGLVQGHAWPDFIGGYPIATMRSIGTRARSATSAGTLTSNFISRRLSRSFGSVIIFMYLQ